MWQEYLRLNSIEETIRALSRYEGQARIIAGGTDLVLEIQSGDCSAKCLVDITQIDALKEITCLEDYITVGAAVTHAEIAASPVIHKHALLLSEAAAEVGSPQIRNSGTIGGNVVNAQPAADTALALLTLDADAEVVGPQGVRRIPLAELYSGAGISTIDPSRELVTGFRFKMPGEPSGSAYQRLGKCKSIALPVMCAAIRLEFAEGKIRDAGISLGPVAPHPFRARKAEEFIIGKTPDAEVFTQTARIARDEANPRDSLLRCNRVYREGLVETLVRSTLERATAVAMAQIIT